MKRHAVLILTLFSLSSLFLIVIALSARGGAWQQRIAANDQNANSALRLQQLRTQVMIQSGVPKLTGASNLNERPDEDPMIQAMQAEAAGLHGDAHRALAQLAQEAGYPEIAALHQKASKDEEFN